MHLDIIWDPANFSTGPVGRAQGPFCALSADVVAQSSAGTKDSPTPPAGDPCHVSMGAEAQRFLQVLEVLNPPGEAAAPEMLSQ